MLLLAVPGFATERITAMAEDDGFISDYELGRRDALREAEERANDGTIGYAEYQAIAAGNAGKAARLMMAGKVRHDTPQAQEILEAVLANRRDRANQLQSSTPAGAFGPPSDSERDYSRVMPDRD